MKAAVIRKFGSPEVFEISDMPVPEISDDEILVKTVTGSINPIDYKQRKGNHRFIFGSPFPIILGYDVAGIVEKTGNRVTRFKKGDRICGVLSGNRYGGGLAEYVKGKETFFTHVPDQLDLKISAALPMAALTALQALRDKGNIQSGQKVLIIGASGGVGHLTVQLAWIFRAEITAVSSIKHAEFLKDLAPVKHVDYNKHNILEIKDRFNIIFDVVGKYSFSKTKHLLKPGGIYITNLPRPVVLWHKLLSLFTQGKKAKTLLMKPSPKDLEFLIEQWKEKKLKIRIDREYHLEEISKAHAYMEEGHTEGKILIHF